MGWFWQDAEKMVTRGSGCPVVKDTSCPYEHDGKINPLNKMPMLSQRRSEGQRRGLDTRRETSTIPRDDQSGHWEYPSPQQMFNALVRKGHTDTDEERHTQAWSMCITSLMKALGRKCSDGRRNMGKYCLFTAGSNSTALIPNLSDSRVDPANNLRNLKFTAPSDHYFLQPSPLIPLLIVMIGISSVMIKRFVTSLITTLDPMGQMASLLLFSMSALRWIMLYHSETGCRSLAVVFGARP